jgi:serine/threonine protein kinase
VVRSVLAFSCSLALSCFKFSRYFHLLFWNFLSASDKPWWNAAQVSWLWTCSPLGVACWAVHAWSRNVVVSCSWTFAGCSTIFVRCRRMVNWLYFCWNDIWLRSFPWTLRYRSAFQDLSATWNAYIWPAVENLPLYNREFPQWQPRLITDFVRVDCQYATDLLEKILRYDPDQRISCRAALEHPYITTQGQQ